MTTIEDIIEAYAMEPANDLPTLERYLRAYPEFTAELLDLSFELDRPEEPDRPLTGADHALIEDAWLRFLKAQA